MIDSLNLENRIDWRGRVADPFPLYEEADLLSSSPSLFDSYPNTVLEAIHTGCPCHRYVNRGDS